MDQIKRTTDVIKAINGYKRNDIEDYELITLICNYFDLIKDVEISQADLHFLKWISSEVGIPHYFDLLQNYSKNSQIQNLNLSYFSALAYESSLFTSEKIKLHKYQDKVLEHFERGVKNRFFLSASTSFGKTFLVYEILQKMRYNNIVLIFPTIALLSENLETVLLDSRYNDYTIHTLSDVRELGEKNMFIYTPERFLSFIENNLLDVRFEFSFIDEIYKIDNEYIIDEEFEENERDVAFRLALHHILLYNEDVLLAGPYIDFPQEGDNASFFNFLTANDIKLLDYNNYEVVLKDFKVFNSKNDIYIKDNANIYIKNINKKKMCIDVVEGLLKTTENIIIYCSRRSDVDGVYSYTQRLIESGILSNHNSQEYSDFIIHLETEFHQDWRLINALKNGIGIHHGLIPKYIQKEIISLFNRKLLRVLVSTTTITEGVNTSAKYLIVTEAMKGTKELKKFDAKNIAGRAGRFSYHYKGNVFILHNNFMQKIDSVADPIKHKNYDKDSKKDEIDLFYSKDEYLTQKDRARRQLLYQDQFKRAIPDYVFEFYKVINRKDKLLLFDKILELNANQHLAIKKLVRNIAINGNIDRGGFEVVLSVINPIVKNTSLKGLIENSSGDYSNLTRLLFSYFIGGMHGMINYAINIKGKTPDNAIKDTASLVYNTFKYQVVKYLGAFNIMYKYYITTISNKKIEEITLLDKLLLQLEHNAFSNDARIVSDYGVPTKIIAYFEEENLTQREHLKSKMDKYEGSILNKVSNLVRK